MSDLNPDLQQTHSDLLIVHMVDIKLHILIKSLCDVVSVRNLIASIELA